MKFLILSRLSHIYSTQRLVQEIQACGFEAEVQDPESADEGLIADILIPRIGTYRYEEALANLERLQNSTGAKVVLNAGPCFHQARHKKRAHQILGDLPQPQLFSEVKSWPVIVKDCLSSQGEGVFLCRTEEELSHCLRKLQGRDILFQEFIAESQGRDLRVFVIGDKVAACMERVSRDPRKEFRSNLSLGGSAHPATLSPAEEETSLAAVQRLGLSYAGVDLIRSHRGSLILEVNPSPGLEGIEKCSQKNIAQKVVLFAEGLYREGPSSCSSLAKSCSRR